MSEPTQPVRPGQIWAPRAADSDNWRRRIRITRVAPHPLWHWPAATCVSWWEERLDTEWRVHPSRKTVIRLDRFPAGYRLAQDAPTATGDDPR